MGVQSLAGRVVTARPCLPAGRELQVAVQIKPERLPGIAFITCLQKQLPKRRGAVLEGWGDFCSWGRPGLVCVHGMAWHGMEGGQDVRTGTCFVSSALGSNGQGMDPGEGRARGGQEAISIFLYLKAPYHIFSPPN